MSRYAQLLPLTVIAEQLGVPREDLPKFRRWSDGFVAQLGQMADLETQVEAARMIVEFQHYFAERLEGRRKEPRDDIISDIANAFVEDERPLDTAESLSILQQLLVAGNETTASAIAEGMLLLVQHPDQLALVEAEPAHLPGLVEEVLRLATPTANMWRVTTEDTSLAGVEIPKGAFALLRFASANRDETHFPDPDRLDVARPNAGDHLALGYGVHFCLRSDAGAQGNGGCVSLPHHQAFRLAARPRGRRATPQAQRAAARTRDLAPSLPSALRFRTRNWRIP